MTILSNVARKLLIDKYMRNEHRIFQLKYAPSYFYNFRLPVRPPIPTKLIFIICLFGDPGIKKSKYYKISRIESGVQGFKSQSILMELR